MSFYAVLLACFSLLSQIDWAPDIADEGFLWYGSLRTFQGQVPLLDFQSYFPGRYYFNAALFNFLGQDLLAVRISAWLFQVLALVLVFRIARRFTLSKKSVILLGALTLFWMTLPYRYYDSAIVIAAVFFAVRLLENPTLSRHLWSGIFTGIALFFGINHGWYAFIIFQALVVLNAFKTKLDTLPRNEFSFLKGLFIGCLPLLGMALFVPGFGAALADTVSVTLSRNNDPAFPFPWPWTVSWSRIFAEHPQTYQRVLEFSHRYAMSFSFLAVPAFYAGSLIFTLRAPKDDWQKNALWTACAVVGAVYLHHLFRRVNIVYLGETITPFLIGVWALASSGRTADQKRARVPLMWPLVLLTLLGPGLLNNLWYRLFLPKGALSQVQVGRCFFWTETDKAEKIENIRRFAKENIPENESIFLAPLLSMHYCILDKVSPVYQLYFCFREPEKNQERMILDLKMKKVKWAIVGDPIIDDFPDLHFSNTHALVWKYLNENFDPYIVEGFPGGHFLWKKKVSS